MPSHFKSKFSISIKLIGPFTPQLLIARSAKILKKNFPKTNPVKYPTCKSFTEETRTTNPAWTARDLQQNNFKILLLDPQENTCMPFNNNLNTRLIEKDMFNSQVN